MTILQKTHIQPVTPTTSSLYWVWEKELTPELCQDIIGRAGGDFEKGRLISPEDIETYNAWELSAKDDFDGDKDGDADLIWRNKKNGTDDNVRKTNIHFNDDDDLFDIVFKYMPIANKNAGWNFQVDSAENFQIAQFPEGGHYDWHIDGLGVGSIHEPQNKIRNNKTRKISLVLWLNEGFEGGDFEFHKGYMKNNVIKPTQGTIIMFPSWAMHRVTPVTKGTRYSLVTWFLGKPMQ